MKINPGSKVLEIVSKYLECRIDCRPYSETLGTIMGMRHHSKLDPARKYDTFSTFFTGVSDALVSTSEVAPWWPFGFDIGNPDYYIDRPSNFPVHQTPDGKVVLDRGDSVMFKNSMKKVHEEKNGRLFFYINSQLAEPNTYWYHGGDFW